MSDDHFYYNSFTTDNPLDEIRCISLLEDCAKVITNWMNVNRLRLNNVKTEYIIFASKGERKKCSFNGIKINDAHIEEKICIKYLGVLLDNELSFRQHTPSAGPREWNNLPLDIRSCRTFPTFKSKLKTHLFRLAFK